jgi:hypothetical protein
MDREQHLGLRRFALDHDVDASEVVRALVARLLDDRETQRWVAEQIEAEEREGAD